MNTAGLPALTGLERCGAIPFGTVRPHLLPGAAAARLPAQPESVIMAAFPYRLPCYTRRNAARFAAVPDYHGVCMARLQKAVGRLKKVYPGKEFAVFTDHSPLPEAAVAAAAGLGVLGQNGLLIDRVYGSYVVLGAIVTDAIVIDDTLRVPQGVYALPRCGDCGACAAVCPAGVIPGGVNSFGDKRARCISALTQKKGGLSDEERALIRAAGSAWGCDLCQEVCPHNRAAVIAPLPEFAAGARPYLTGEEPSDGRVYAWRGKETLLRNLTLLEQGERTDIP